jgi:HK97 family phage major capsid protein
MNEEEIKKAQLEVQTLWTSMKAALEKEADERKKFGEGKGETKTTIDKLNARIDELELKISRPGVGTETKVIEPTLEYKAYERFLRNKDLTVEETKALTTADDVSGGYLAPVEVSRDILTKITEISPMRSICTVQTIGAKALEQLKDNSEWDSYWDDEVETEQALTLAKETIPAHNQRKTVLVTPELIEDSIVNIDAYIRERLVQAYAIKEGTAFVKGDGVKRAEGFLKNVEILAAYVPSGSALLLTADSLIDLSFAPKEGYLRNATFVLNRSTLKTIRKLTKSLGGTANAADYVWQPGFGNLPNTILAYPYILVPDMPDIAANAYALAFGDFRIGYKIVDRLGLTIQRLIEKYAPNIGYLGRRRVGGQVVMPEAIKVMKIAAS